MTFVLDGYNLLHAIGLLTGRVQPGGLEKARNALLDLVAAAHTGEPGSVTVVFDARREGRGDGEERHGDIRVLYTHTEEADDRIEWLIAHDTLPHKMIVVSNDHRLQRAAQRRRCQSWTCERYLDWTERQRTERRTDAVPEKPAAGVPDDWLATFGSLDDEPEMRELFGPDFGDGDGI